MMSCLAPSSPQFSLWKWSRKWRSASRGITRDLDVSTPAELQKMEAAAIASRTFEQQSARLLNIYKRLYHQAKKVKPKMCKNRLNLAIYLSGFWREI